MIENLLKLAEDVKLAEEKFDNEKLNLELLKADYVLKNDWEKVLGKPKPTQKEKDSYIEKETEVLKRKVKSLERDLKYKKMVYEIYIIEAKQRR